MNKDSINHTLIVSKTANAIEPLPIGTVIHNNYEVVTVLSKGSFSWVYLAKQACDSSKKNKLVAIKEYAPDGYSQRSANNSWIKPIRDYAAQFQAGLENFFSEIHALCSLRSAYITNVLDAFIWCDNAYFVMDYCEGVTLEQKISQKIKEKSHFNQPLLHVSTLLCFAQSLAEILRQIHATGWLHLDIKPANLYVRRDGSAMLLDLGSARHTLKQRAPHNGITYTPRFAAPELREHQLTGSSIGPWSDVYSFGACLYQMICGHAPSLKGVDSPGFHLLLSHNIAMIHTDQTINTRLLTLIMNCMLQNTAHRTASFFTIEQQLNDIDEQVNRAQLKFNPPLHSRATYY